MILGFTEPLMASFIGLEVSISQNHILHRSSVITTAVSIVLLVHFLVHFRVEETLFGSTLLSSLLSE